MVKQRRFNVVCRWVVPSHMFEICKERRLVWQICLHYDLVYSCARAYFGNIHEVASKENGWDKMAAEKKS